MMGGIAGGMGAMVAGITNDAVVPVDLKSPASTTAPTGSDDMTIFKQKLEKLKLMKDAGMLSDEEFDEEKKKLLNSL